MSKINPFFLFLFFLLLISLLSITAVLLGFNTQYYLWEFALDVKVLVIALLLLYFGKKYRWDFGLDRHGIRNWIPKLNAFAFFIPLLLLALVVAIGMLSRKTSYEEVENSYTFLLATIVDIPAIYFFSITVVLLEEIIFRGLMFDLVSRDRGNLVSVLSSSLIWTAVNFDKAAQIQNVTFTLATSELLSIMAVGVICSSFYCLSRSIWPGYSLRIGLRVFSSTVLTTRASDTNAYFQTDSPIFSNDGILISILILILSFVLLRFYRKAQQLVKIHQN